MDQPACAVLGRLLVLSGLQSGAVAEQATLSGTSQVGLLRELHTLVVRVRYAGLLGASGLRPLAKPKARSLLSLRRLGLGLRRGIESSLGEVTKVPHRLLLQEKHRVASVLD